MEKQEILFNVNLTNLAYSKTEKIDWKGLELKSIGWINNNKTDTQGFVATNKDTLYIVWRGSESPQDFIKDSQVRKVNFVKDGEKVHFGFNTAFKSIKEDLYSIISKIKTDKLTKVVICGHSLGAALTVLSAYSICNDFPELKPLVKTLTIGCPRVGNSTFKNNYNELVPYSLRIVNDTDLVTRIPKIKYTHINDGLTLNDNGEVISHSSLNPFRFIWEMFISDITGEAVKDHMIDKYLEVINKWNGVIDK